MSDDPWFVYRKEVGRFRAMPISWQGWCTLFLGIALTAVVSFFVMAKMDGLPFMLRAIMAGAVTLAGIATICWIAYRKGKPSG